MPAQPAPLPVQPGLARGSQDLSDASGVARRVTVQLPPLLARDFVPGQTEGERAGPGVSAPWVQRPGLFRAASSCPPLPPAVRTVTASRPCEGSVALPASSGGEWGCRSPEAVVSW